jgi:hypothetical protein
VNRRLTTLVALLATALLAVPAAVAAHARDRAVPAGPDLHQLLDRWRHRAGVPAATMVVDAPGRAPYATAAGTAVPVVAPFRGASIT